MIVAERKPFDEIKNMVSGYKKVLTVGCGTCVAVCLAGGSKEVETLNAELTLAFGGKDIEFGAETVERQCDMEFLDELESKAGEYDAFLSMACGAGVQFLAQRFPDKPVLPAVNTSIYRCKSGCGLVRGEMPGLWRLRSGYDGWYLPCDHVCQGPFQRSLRRHQPRVL